MAAAERLASVVLNQGSALGRAQKIPRHAGGVQHVGDSLQTGPALARTWPLAAHPQRAGRTKRPTIAGGAFETAELWYTL